MKQRTRDDIEGSQPTEQRLLHAGGAQFFDDKGGKRSGRRVFMHDDALSRAMRMRKISEQEFLGLRTYAMHWLAGGLQSNLSSVDLNRVLAVNPLMSHLARTEAQADHRAEYHEARIMLGFRPGFVADSVACHGYGLEETGEALGFASPYRGRERAAELLRDAGSRLFERWHSRRRI